MQNKNSDVDWRVNANMADQREDRLNSGAIDNDDYNRQVDTAIDASLRQAGVNLNQLDIC